MTITITEQPESGALRLAIDTVQTITSVVRSDTNGVADVRTLPGLLPWSPALAERARNHVPNPSAETNTTGYQISTGTGATAAVTRDTLAPRTGTGCARATWTVGGSSAGGMYYRAMAGTAGDVASVGVWARWSVSGNATLSITVRNVSTDVITVASASQAVVADTWTWFSVEGFVIPGDYTYVQAWPRMTAPMPTGSTQDIDGLIICKAATVADVFDGDSADTDTLIYAWTGTPHASASTATGAASELVLTDFEAATGVVSYTVGSETQQVAWDIGAPWLFVPVMPAYSVRLKTVLEYSAAGQSLGTVHELLGREDPVAVLRGMGTRRGSLRLYCGTFAEALVVVESTRRGEVLMLRQPEHQGMDMYFTATSYGIPTLDADGGASVFGVDISYVELARPIGGLSGSLGWTFAALAAAYPTFSALPGAYATFQDLLLNETR